MPRPLVLVVEDDAGIREALQELLQDEGYRVLLASNGMEALALLEGGARPAALLVDLVMPVMTGQELLERLRQQASFAELAARVVVMTAALKPPATSAPLLQKPFDVEELLKACAVASGQER